MQLRPTALLVARNGEAAEPTQVAQAPVAEVDARCVTPLAPGGLCGVGQVANPAGLEQATGGVSAARPAPHSPGQIRKRAAGGAILGRAYGPDLSTILAPQVGGSSGHGAALDGARRYFFDHRDDFIRDLRRVRPGLGKEAENGFSDEWVARNVVRYGKQLDGQGDGMRAITATGLLIAIAREADIARAEGRPFNHPLLEAALRTRADLERDLTSAGYSDEEARFELNDIGDRLRSSTAGYEEEIAALRKQPYYKLPDVPDTTPAAPSRRYRREAYASAPAPAPELSPHESNVRQNIADQQSADTRNEANRIATNSNLAERYIRNGQAIGGPTSSLS